MKSKRIALTGGIGSGKSLALNILAELGFNTLSSDKIVADLYSTRKVKKLIKALFPSAVTGRLKLNIDKKELSRLAFSSGENHQKLTSLVTPLVMNQIDSLTKNKEGLYFVEVPLLFERNYQDNFDGVWVITRPLNDRIESVKTRSNLTEKQIFDRIAKQVDYETLDLTNYTVIENAGDKERLKEIIKSKLKEL